MASLAVSYYGAWIKIGGDLPPIWQPVLLELAVSVAGVNAAINLTQTTRPSQAGNSLGIGFVFSRTKKQEGQLVNRSAHRASIYPLLSTTMRIL
jgi:hypothetical protein